MTVAQSGVVQVDSDLYFYANTTINGIVVLNSRLMGLEESGTLILGETARVTYEEDGLIACSSDAYIYQYCDLTIPKFESGSYNKISNGGHYIAYGALTILGSVYNGGIFEIQSENAEVSAGGVFENGEDAVLQIQAQYSLTNNGTIYNVGAINVMSGGTFTDNGTITGGGTINDQNPKAPLLAPMLNAPQESEEQVEESELPVETPEDTEDAETPEMVSENTVAAIAPKAEETEEDNLQIDEKETE